MRILDAITLEDECPEPFRYSRDAVTHCMFSHDSKWFATGVSFFSKFLYSLAFVLLSTKWWMHQSIVQFPSNFVGVCVEGGLEEAYLIYFDVIDLYLP